MRHQKRRPRLGRNQSHRHALLRNLAISLILHEKITTTLARGKELRRLGDKLVSFGKKGDLASRRLAASLLNSKEAVRRLFAEVAPRFQSRAGGYTRVVKSGWRAGDGASLCMIEFIPEEGKSYKDKPGSKKKGKEVKEEGKKEKGSLVAR